MHRCGSLLVCVQLFVCSIVPILRLHGCLTRGDLVMTKVFTSFTMVLLFWLAADARTPRDESVTVGLGKQVALDSGLLKVKFLSVLEDSRCPMNATCVWAGRVRIKAVITKGRLKPRTIVLSSDEPAKDAGLYGYSFQLTDLKPQKGDPRSKAGGPVKAVIQVKIYT
jgi:hypothetical protein